MTDVIAGRFALCDPIARGGSGVVWRAYDRKLQHFCAAKVLRRRDAGDLLRFVREQSVRMAHSHVLTPYSWAAEDAHVLIASELVDGGSVSTLIGDYGALSEPTVAILLDQLLDALEHVHAAGFVHRDVKPANLLLRATGTGRPHLMLSDFGIAMHASDAHLTELGTVVGTPAYLAPEVLAGGVPPDPRQDLYAAGRVAIALLAGEQPEDGEAVGVPAGPGGLRDVVLALTQANAAARLPSASAARVALRPALGDPLPRTAGGEPVDVLHQLPKLPDEAYTEAGAAPAPDTVRVAPVRRTRRRRPWAIGVATAAVVVAVGVPVALAMNNSSGGAPRTPRDSRPPPSATHSAATRASSAPSTAAPATAPAKGTAIRIGGSCTWQQQGNRVTTRDGTTLVCTAQDGAYIWTKA